MGEISKPILIALQSLLIAALISAKLSIAILLLLFIANLGLGIITDVLYNHNRFHFNKFFKAILELLVYTLIAFGIAVIAHLKKEVELGNFTLNVLSWLFIYAYGVNIFKNLKRMIPDSIVINFCYYFLSFEIIKKIPHFSEFLEKEKTLV